MFRLEEQKVNLFANRTTQQNLITIPPRDQNLGFAGIIKSSTTIAITAEASSTSLIIKKINVEKSLPWH